MKVFGYRLVREKGIQVGDHEAAIIDLQARVNVLEHNQKVKVHNAKVEAKDQDEIQKILAAGNRREADDFWGDL